ncbi:hypothetical protein QBC42DRAFT_253072 [Cladorrhinum samala]|uniref:Uncharacterized protein n=1 Tax=Cladorrhinum samala TaxID=585594 RepID=A0AAV9HLI5_9PEZI|nr:hypothetical protein QBC42DRAFT_253072 [Cladorrhinum samala]
MVVPESPIEFQSAAPTSTLKKPIFPIRAPTLSGNEDQGVRRDRKGTTRRGFERSSAAIADQTARETPFNIHSRFYLIPGEWHGVENVAIVSGGAPSSTHWGADHWTPLIPLDANTSTLYTKAQGLQLSIRLGKYAHEGVQYTISSESPRASAVEYWSSGTECERSNSQIEQHGFCRQAAGHSQDIFAVVQSRKLPRGETTLLIGAASKEEENYRRSEGLSAAQYHFAQGARIRITATRSTTS